MRTKLVLAALLACAACSKPAPVESSDPGSDEAAVPSPEAAAEAKKVFATRCVPCHGSIGQGDGPASASLNPKPRKYADKTWQASVTDDYIQKIIKYGGAAVGKSPAMPNNPDLTDPVIAGLKDIVRSFGKK